MRIVGLVMVADMVVVGGWECWLTRWGECRLTRGESEVLLGIDLRIGRNVSGERVGSIRMLW